MWRAVVAFAAPFGGGEQTRTLFRVPKMRRDRRFRIALLCLALVLALTDWRWLQLGTGRNYQAAMLTHSEVYPVSVNHRMKLLRQVETPPPPADLPMSELVALLTHPDEFSLEPWAEPAREAPADVDPLFAFMSMQV
jgi:hypothetical protein